MEVSKVKIESNLQWGLSIRQLECGNFQDMEFVTQVKIPSLFSLRGEFEKYIYN